LIFFQQGYKKVERTIDPKNGVHTVDIVLQPLSRDLDGITISGEKKSENAMTTLRPVDGMAIYSG